MPNVPTYEQPSLGLQPTEIGIESTAAAARRGGAFYNQAAQSFENLGSRIGQGIRGLGDAAVAYLDHQQINTGAEKGANLFADLTDQWNKTAASADPHDPSVAQRFREEVLEPKLKQFAGGDGGTGSWFTTEKAQAWSDHFVATTRQHFFEKTEADMSRLAADAVTSTVTTMANRFSNVGISDPSAVPAMLDNVDHSIDGVIGANPNLKGADAARVRDGVGLKVKEQIIKAGAFGAIQNSADPERAAAEWTRRYPDYINGAEAMSLGRAAKVQSRSLAAADKAATVYQKQIDSLAVDTARNKIWADNVTIGSDGMPQIKPDFFKQATQIPMQHPNAPNATQTAETLLNWGLAVQNREKKPVDNPASTAALDERMFAADNPTTEIDVLKAETRGELTHQTGQVYRELVKARDQEGLKDPLFKIAMDNAKGQIVSHMNGITLGSDQYVGFMQKFMNEYLKEKRAGTLPPNALNANDPDSLFSKTIEPYRSALAASVRANGGVGAPPAAPAAPASAPAPRRAPAAAPAVGEIRAGYRFKGGDPSKRESWEPVS